MRREGGARERSGLLKRWLGEQLEAAWGSKSKAARECHGMLLKEGNGMMRQPHAQESLWEEGGPGNAADHGTGRQQHTQETFWEEFWETPWSMVQERQQHAREALWEEDLATSLSMVKGRQWHTLEKSWKEAQRALQGAERERRAALGLGGMGRVPWKCHTGQGPHQVVNHLAVWGCGAMTGLGPAQGEEWSRAAKVSDRSTGRSNLDRPSLRSDEAEVVRGGTHRRAPQDGCKGCSGELLGLQGSS